MGQRVSVEPGVPDMTCEQCLAGRYNLCPDMRFFATPPIDGSLAEFVTVHEAFAHPVPEDMSDDAAALLEPLSVGRLGQPQGRGHRWQPRPHHRRRPVGLVAAQCAAAFGATEVVVSDVNPHRLGLADDLGATGTINVAATRIAASGFQPDRAAGVLGPPRRHRSRASGRCPGPAGRSSSGWAATSCRCRSPRCRTARSR